ncbi:MAG: RNA polymerase sporulation sigma factor SigK [Lachnospiraceae bacterium]|nr:RNA polymerase sporulation sigma factor SigK [Lachnospiraceae bacterium]
MKTFQKPLSSEEEACYIRALQEENSDKVREARQILIERNLRLVAHIAKKYMNTDEDMEDLISIGTIGLIKAVQTFDAGKGKLVTYAARCIENELLMRLRAKRKSSKEVSLYEPIGMDKEGNEISLLDIIEQEQIDIVERMEQETNLGKLVPVMNKVLNSREKEIILLRYGLVNGVEVTQREIGKQYGISRSYVSRIEKRALEKMRDEFDQNTK